ncbi:mixed lineage kinase domain-like protein [Xenopus laevis]|uniref:Mixed lineage kinase domain-like protein n=1 Tax=Xenopus laevis TaxID=8355 RepID=A0A8J1MWD7_XENLA|nr:mixed lineage kinase domain-like protein [Xenopus laevis]
MELLKSILKIAHNIYSLHEKASCNKKQCNRLRKRIELLMVPVEKLNKQAKMRKDHDDILQELLCTMSNAESWIQKYSNRMWLLKFIKANRIKEEFDLINDRLRDAAEALIMLTSVEHTQDFLKYFDEKEWKKQNIKAIEADINDIKEYLKGEMGSVAENVVYVADKVDSMSNKFDNMTTKMDRLEDLYKNLEAQLFSGIRMPWNPKIIQAADLVQTELLMETRDCLLYRGDYHKSPVTIKVLKGELSKDNETVRRSFDSDCKTMKKFECMNILRLYGICIDNSKSEPYYCMVTEFCEKGTLRELLSSDKNLPWEQRILMALDAARALYRLHQSEHKTVLYGNLSSSKFLVDGNGCLKLYGFGLSKTESSMRRSCNVKKREKNTEWIYTAPETLKDINAYDKHSEIYSLGVVFYEIASGNIPLQGLPVSEKLEEVYQLLSTEMEMGIPTDCPTILQDLIKKTTDINPKNRPSAGAVVDLLLNHLNKEANHE